MRSWTSLTAVLLASFLVLGCKSGSSSGGNTQASVSGTSPLSAPAVGSMRLITGAAPMQYLLASGGVVRINDITAKEQLLKGAVPPQTMIRIDPKAGVNVGEQNVIPGPLPSGHQYEIWLDRE